MSSKYLNKKGNTGGLEGGSGVAPHQPTMKAPTPGVRNTTHQSHGNAKVQGVTQPGGKPHAKVMTGSPNMKHGRYL